MLKRVVGAYSPRSQMSRIHCSPEDAVILHQETRCRVSRGGHWGTWILTDEEMTEPPKRLRAACVKAGIEEGVFGVTEIGETTLVRPVV